MKTNIFILAMLFIALMYPMNSFSQDEPMECYPIGTTWEEAFVIYVGRELQLPRDFYRVKSEVIGDTVISDIQYKTIERVRTEDVYDSSTVGTKDTCFIREQDGRVYFRDCRLYEEEESIPIYDFNWENLPDHFWVNRNDFDLSSFDLIQVTLLDGNTYDCLTDTINLVPYRIIRTIGQDFCGLIKRSGVIRQRTPHQLKLTKFTRNGVVIFEEDIPTPVFSNIHTIPSEDNPKVLGVFTLQGMRMKEHDLSPGVYIIDGQKTVVR